MTLDDYLRQPDAMSATDLARLLNNMNPDQVRQWRHGHAGRKPSPENCVAIEQATKGQVTRKDLRPDDWQKIWPELIEPSQVVLDRLQSGPEFERARAHGSRRSGKDRRDGPSSSERRGGR